MWRCIGVGFFFRVDELDRDVGFRAKGMDQLFERTLDSNVTFLRTLKYPFQPSSLSPLVLSTPLFLSLSLSLSINITKYWMISIVHWISINHKIQSNANKLSLPLLPTNLQCPCFQDITHFPETKNQKHKMVARCEDQTHPLFPVRALPLKYT
jgi:hypothetical protein